MAVPVDGAHSTKGVWLAGLSRPYDSTVAVSDHALADSKTVRPLGDDLTCLAARFILNDRFLGAKVVFLACFNGVICI